jgi:2-amino-4-hydroxy-6-hydroxymethyldihydropteridine diphosphokinase
MNYAFLSLGSNEGDRIQWLKKAVDMIVKSCGPFTKLSSVYETAAWGITEQADFLNMVARIKTVLSPHELLTAILSIEIALGRKREVKWGPRIIDIDILLYNYEIIDSSELIVPHPFMQDRRFILAPLAQIAPAYLHPKLNKTITELLADSPDTLEVNPMGPLPA